MSLNVYFIPGSKDSACRNNAYSFVGRDAPDQPERLYTIVPAADVPEGADVGDLTRAFYRAAYDEGVEDFGRLRDAIVRRLGGPAPQV